MGLFDKFFGKKKSVQKTTPSVDTQNDIEKKLADVLEQLRPFKKTAYLPIVKQVAAENSSHSKLGGYPFLRNENDWPLCPNCKKHMPLFLQLNLNDVPTKEEDSVIQLFYCTTHETVDCESDLEAYLPFSSGSVRRKISISNESKIVRPNNENILIEKRIIDWELKEDYPHWEQYAELNIQIEDDEDVEELMDLREVGRPLGGEKLFGWPYWIQGSEYPFDRKTGSRMELLFQIDSDTHLDYMFGDAGIGHLTQSPDHPDELGFGWACY